MMRSTVMRLVGTACWTGMQNLAAVNRGHALFWSEKLKRGLQQQERPGPELWVSGYSLQV